MDFTQFYPHAEWQKLSHEIRTAILNEKKEQGVSGKEKGGKGKGKGKRAPKAFKKKVKKMKAQISKLQKQKG